MAAQLVRRTVRTADGTELTVHDVGDDDAPAVVVAPAMAVPQRFYRHAAAGLAARGFRVTTFDYRGVAASPPAPAATLSDWALQDLPAVVARAAARSGSTSLVGHSLGGQIAGLLPEPSLVDAMVGVVAQSGYWRLQGGRQPWLVRFQVTIAMPLLARVFDRMPFERIGFGVDVPSAVATGWAAACRDPDYLAGDPSLPVARYDDVTAPMLAYSIDDDDWGTPRAVDAMMRHYPRVERRHLVPAAYGMDAIGHLGAFRPGAEQVWDEIATWLHAHRR